MEIIKHGKPKIKKVFFTCDDCGCEFAADDGEYTGITNQMEYLETKKSYKCKCPECGQTAYNN